MKEFGFFSGKEKIVIVTKEVHSKSDATVD